MPYCTACGNRVGEQDAFCAFCGARQAPPGTAGPSAASQISSSSGSTAGAPGVNSQPVPSDRTMLMLCYVPVLGWIPSIVVLASDRFRHNRQARFHAFQGLYLSVAWLLVDWVAKPVFERLDLPFGLVRVSSLLKMALVGAWVFMLVKVSQNESYKLPLVGDLAEKSVAEQQ